MPSHFAGVYEMDGGSDVHIWAVERDAGTVVWAEWGGWHWRAEAPDGGRARTRLETRITLKDPFYGRDKDWGNPGFRLGTLDPGIEPETRRYMERVGATSADFPEEIAGDVNSGRASRGDNPAVVAVVKCGNCSRFDLSRWFQVRSLGHGVGDWTCPYCGSKSMQLIEMRWEEYQEAGGSS